MGATANALIWLTFLVYIFAWIKGRQINIKSCDGYFLAERKLSGLLIAGSLMLTNFSVELSVGIAGQSYSTNMGLMTWEITSALALVAMAFIFLPHYLKMGITTIPEYFEKRYGAGLRQFTAVIFVCVYIAVLLPSILYSGSVFIEKSLGLGEIFKLSNRTAVILISYAVAAFSSLYCGFGNLKTISKADVVYGIALFAGGLILCILGFAYLGKGDISSGVYYFLKSSPEKMNAFHIQEKVPSMVLFVGFLTHNLFYWCTNQSFVQRMISADSLKEAQKGAVFSGLFKLFGILYVFIPGVIAYQINPTFNSFDTVFPMLIGIIVPRAALFVVGTILFGVTLSAFTRVLHSSAAMLTLDIYRPVFNKDASDEQIVLISKKVIALLSLAVALFMPVLITVKVDMTLFLNTVIGYINMPILAAVLIGIFSKSATALSVKVMFFVHFITYTIFITIFGTNYLCAEAALLVLDVLVMLITGALFQGTTHYVSFDADAVSCEPWKYASAYAIVISILSLLLYVIFSPLLLAK